MTCNGIENRARQLVEREFAEPWKSGKILWEEINFQKNTALATKFDVTASSIVVAVMQGNEIMEFRRLDESGRCSKSLPNSMSMLSMPLKKLLKNRRRKHMTWVKASLPLPGWAFSCHQSCPLASNVAAISFIGRQLQSRSAVMLSGLLYTSGRTVTYVVLGALLSSGLLAGGSFHVFCRNTSTKFSGLC